MSGQLLDFNAAKRQGEVTGARTVDADDIRTRLHADPRAFIDWMFQGRAFCGKSEARVGDVYGTPGASLSIQLTGKDAGLWKDHATNEGGDLIGLYRAFRGYRDNSNFVLSLKEIARDFFGDPVEVERSAWQPSPLEWIEKKKTELGTKPRADLIELGAPVANYTYYDTRGNVTAAVTRYEPDGTRESKTFRPYCFRTIEGVTKWVAGAPDLRPLYNLPDVALAQTVVLCEGEGCADALNKLGIVATSAMQGAHAPIDKTDWSPLAGKTVVIWPDKDEPGFAYAKAVSERLAALGCTIKGVTPLEDAPARWDAADCVLEGRDAHQLIANALPIAAKPKPRITVLDIDEIENIAPPSWLVDGILTKNGLSVLWGRSGAMKSFVALDMALCVATGAQWHGKAVEQGLVIYVAAEGAHGLGRRAVGWRRTRGRNLPKPRFKLIPQPVALTSSDLDAMVQALLELDGQPVLIIIDTLARTFGAGDENKQADMNAYVTAADRLRDATGANVMIIHHSGVHEDKRERGSNVLRGAADTIIKVSRTHDNLDIINEAPAGKQKDAEEFKTVKLRTAKIAFEQQGIEQTTLILNLREDDGSPTPEGEGAAPRLGGVERAIMSAFEKNGREPLGAIRLAAMTQKVKGTVYASLRNLEEKKLIEKVRSKDGSRDEWRPL